MIFLLTTALATPPAAVATTPDRATGAPAPPPDPRAEPLAAWLAEGGRPPEEARELAAGMLAFEDAIPWQTGHVSLHDGAIALDLAPGDRYAPPEHADRVLQAWGNPPDPDTGGLLVPAGARLFGPGSWAVLLSFEQDGWVDDSEAANLDYDEILAQKQAAEEAANEERRSLELETLTLEGWAESPHYDAATRVLYWATLAKASGGGRSLNYDVRVLGRRGVLSLNAIAGAEALADVKSAMERVRGVASFQPGHTYDDYVAGVDEKAAYGIGALVAGGALAAGAKAGLFKGLLAALIAGKKLVLAGVVAAGAALRAAWGALGRRSDPGGR